jgi:hypothetical protein
MKNEFTLIDKAKPKEQKTFSIRMDLDEYEKLSEYAKEANMNFHRFIKAILNGYIDFKERSMNDRSTRK